MESVRRSTADYISYDGPLVWTLSNQPFNFRDVENEIRVRVPKHVDFVPLSVITDLVHRLLREVNLESESANGVRAALDTLVHQWANTNLSSESVVYSVIRRISRESMASIRLIDALCESITLFIDDVFEQTGKRVVLVVEDAQWADRPSLKILCHLSRLIESPKLSQVWVFSRRIDLDVSPSPTHDDMRESIIRARQRIFCRVYEEIRPEVIAIDEPADLTVSDLVELHAPVEGTEQLRTQAALALVTANYELGYLVCGSAMQHADSPEALSEVFRIIGLIHSNMDFVDSAYDAFREAAHLVGDGPKRAHVEYLCALLATKRLYDNGLARTHYEAGFRFVGESTESERLEKAWLINGVSFLEAIQLSGYDEAQRDKAIEGVLRQELAALDMLKQDKGQGAIYLRFNLYSNIAFLLEIKKDYKAALKLWSGVFGKYSYIDGQEADSPYLYRAGMLQYKSGEPSLAVEILRRAKVQATRESNRVYAQISSYALAFVCSAGGRLAEAEGKFLDAMSIAYEMKDPVAFRNSALGFLQVKSRLDDLQQGARIVRDRFGSFFERVIEPIDDVVTGERLSRVEITPPKTKLPSYYPAMDLESVPKVDMNRFLVANQGWDR